MIAVADIGRAVGRAQDVAELRNERVERPGADTAQWIVAGRNAAGGAVAHGDERSDERVELTCADAAQRVVFSAAASWSASQAVGDGRRDRSRRRRDEEWDRVEDVVAWAVSAAQLK